MRAVRDLDGFHPLRTALREVAGLSSEWAGIPMPLEGERLIIEPSYPYAALGEIGKPADPDPSEPGVWRVRNRFYSRRWRCYVTVGERDGRVRAILEPGHNHIAQDLRTMACSVAWGVEQEQRALMLLGSMLRHRVFKQYLLTGMFLERSDRSGVMYCFRRLKPTIALAPWRTPDQDEPARVLAALCQHPIGYYDQSWAGAMCPTDDVVAALTMMRGDEPLFWKRCNQIPPTRPEAGL